MKKNKYKFTKIFFILGWILALVIFFTSSSLISYGKSIIIFTLIVSSVGWMIDKFILKQPLIPIILIVLYILIGIFYLNQELHRVTVPACKFTAYENIFTGKCKTICMPLGHSTSWYWKESGRCIVNLPLK